MNSWQFNILPNFCLIFSEATSSGHIDEARFYAWTYSGAASFSEEESMEKSAIWKDYSD